MWWYIVLRNAQNTTIYRVAVITPQRKTQYNEFQHITIIANNAGIPKIIIDEALRCHKKISEHQTFRGQIAMELLRRQYMLHFVFMTARALQKKLQQFSIWIIRVPQRGAKMQCLFWTRSRMICTTPRRQVFARRDQRRLLKDIAHDCK